MTLENWQAALNFSRT